MSVLLIQRLRQRPKHRRWRVDMVNLTNDSASSIPPMHRVCELTIKIL